MIHYCIILPQFLNRYAIYFWHESKEEEKVFYFTLLHTHVITCVGYHKLKYISHLMLKNLPNSEMLHVLWNIQKRKMLHLLRNESSTLVLPPFCFKFNIENFFYKGKHKRLAQVFRRGDRWRERKRRTHVMSRKI